MAATLPSLRVEGWGSLSRGVSLGSGHRVRRRPFDGSWSRFSRLLPLMRLSVDELPFFVVVLLSWLSSVGLRTLRPGRRVMPCKACWRVFRAVLLVNPCVPNCALILWPSGTLCSSRSVWSLVGRLVLRRRCDFGPAILRREGGLSALLLFRPPSLHHPFPWMSCRRAISLS